MNEAILNTPMQSNDADAATVREYLIALLAAVWDEGEGFSGKRPFGNSGWQWELYECLVRAGHVTGRFDEGGFLDEVDGPAADAIITAAIRSLA